MEVLKLLDGENKPTMSFLYEAFVVIEKDRFSCILHISYLFYQNVEFDFEVNLLII